MFVNNIKKIFNRLSSERTGHTDALSNKNKIISDISSIKTDALSNNFTNFSDKNTDVSNKKTDISNAICTSIYNGAYETIDKYDPTVKYILLFIIKGKGHCPVSSTLCMNNCLIWDYCMDLQRQNISLFNLRQARFNHCIDLYVSLYGEDALKGDLVKALI